MNSSLVSGSILDVFNDENYNLITEQCSSGLVLLVGKPGYNSKCPPACPLENK